jgi:hypothetical protein
MIGEFTCLAPPLVKLAENFDAAVYGAESGF